MTDNQNPEQKARDNIDAQLKQAGWIVQSAKRIDLNAGLGQAVREYQTDVGPADYVLFIDKKAVGVIEAKREEEGQRLTAHESQTEGYAAVKLKWVDNKAPLPFLYESTGILTRFTDAAIPNRVRVRYSASIARKRSGSGCLKWIHCVHACTIFRCSTRVSCHPENCACAIARKPPSPAWKPRSRRVVRAR